MEILEGYRPASEGEVTVLGVDPAHASSAWRQRVGIVLQECKLQPRLTPREVVAQYAGYYNEPRGVDEVLDLVGLADKADARTATLSGGQQRRLDVALALVGDPELLFLDEPTTGFDPSARRQAWSLIANLRALGKTVLLTTHYMEEAQALADRVAIIVSGRIVAEGAPGDISGPDGDAAMITFRLPDGLGGADLPAGVRALASVSGPDISLRCSDPVPLLRELTTWAESDPGRELDALEVRRPTLEDHYLALVGADSNGKAL